MMNRPMMRNLHEDHMKEQRDPHPSTSPAQPHHALPQRGAGNPRGGLLAQLTQLK